MGRNRGEGHHQGESQGIGQSSGSAGQGSQALPLISNNGEEKNYSINHGRKMG